MSLELSIEYGQRLLTARQNREQVLAHPKPDKLEQARLLEQADNWLAAAALAVVENALAESAERLINEAPSAEIRKAACGLADELYKRAGGRGKPELRDHYRFWLKSNRGTDTQRYLTLPVGLADSEVRDYLETWCETIPAWRMSDCRYGAEGPLPPEQWPKVRATRQEP